MINIDKYKRQLYEIQNSSISAYTVFPKLEPHFFINADTREIDVPAEFSFLALKNDHCAETIYFQIDRFFDGRDLSEYTCVVQYINTSEDKKTENEGIYPVTNMDLESEEGKIIFAWTLQNDATCLSGSIYFSVRFYSINDSGSFTYNFNTLPASSYILDTLNVKDFVLNTVAPSQVQVWIDKMNEISTQFVALEQETETLREVKEKLVTDSKDLLADCEQKVEDCLEAIQMAGEATEEAKNAAAFMDELKGVLEKYDANINGEKLTFPLLIEGAPAEPGDISQIAFGEALYDLKDTEARRIADLAISNDEKGIADGVATLDSEGKLPISQHPSGDGNEHVPATGTENNGKFLKAGTTGGAISWEALAKSDVGLSNVDNTSDVDKPISTAQQEELDKKVSATRKINEKTLDADITLSASDVGAVPTSSMGVANGIATLDSNGKLVSSQLHSYTNAVVSIPVASWSSEAPYTATIAVPGLKATDTVTIHSHTPKDIGIESTKLYRQLAGYITDGESLDGQMIFYCVDSKPTADFDVLLEGVSTNG